MTLISAGPASPLEPVHLTHISVSSESATVQWIVPTVAYTAESYVVNYGTVQDSLTFSSAEVTGSSDITITNQVYSVQLSDLDSETTYFYQVVATNDANSTTSTVATFTTAVQGT